MKSLKIILILLVVVGIFFAIFGSKNLHIFGVLRKSHIYESSFSDFHTTNKVQNLASVLSSFVDIFSGGATTEETSSISDSANPNWWLSDGAYFYMVGGVGQTIQGNLAQNDFWRESYLDQDPMNTDDGYHPQNVFRLVNRASWENLQQDVYFTVVKQNLSSSVERDGWNGLALLGRHKDSDNFYYTGINVDGTAVIDSIKNGIGQNLYQQKIFSGTYNRDTNPTLLPLNTQIGLRSVIGTLGDGSVSIKLYMDNGRTGTWTQIASAIDSNSPILGSYHTALDSNFMDVQFRDYNIQELSLDSFDGTATSTLEEVPVIPLPRNRENHPVISLIGDEIVIVREGDTYTDAGASANDDEDGDLTPEIQVNGLPDTKNPGDYTVTYDVQDADRNFATQVSRAVQVLPLKVISESEIKSSADTTMISKPITSSGGGGGGGGGSSPSVVSPIEIITPEGSFVVEKISAPDLIPDNEVKTSTSAIDSNKKLVPGVEGGEVLKVQNFLSRDIGFMGGVKLNGYFGPATTKAVQDFQVKYGIIASGTPSTTGFGNIGPKTRKKMNEVYKTLHKGVILFNTP